MQGVLDKFFSKKSSFTQSEEPIEDTPVITICFAKSWYEYGRDFNIEYGFQNGNEFYSSILKKGKSLTKFEKDVYLEKLITIDFGKCYKISSKSIPIMKYYTRISIHFNESIPYTDLPSKLNVYVTSEKNSYGVVVNTWLNGRIATMEVEKNISKSIDLKPEKYDYLANNDCSQESYYECFSRLYKEELKQNSMSECSPISLPRLQTCKLNKSSDEKYAAIFWNVLKQIQENTKCPKPCTTLGYYGKISTESTWNGTFSFGYGFLSSKTLRGYQEYYIYDVISMIGSVGGTLGMCVGFSFTGVITCLFNMYYDRIGMESSNIQPFNVSEIDAMKMNARINEHEKLLKIILKELDLN